MKRFVDLFCGGGTAAKDMTDAGLVHVVGYDHWQPAIDNMRANGGSKNHHARSAVGNRPQARRWLKSDDHRKLMGLPDDYKLTGTERDMCKIIGNGVPYVCSHSIGKFLMNNLT